MKPKLLLGLALVLCGGLFAYFIPFSPIHGRLPFQGVRAISSASQCINNLRQIEAAKNEWALEQHKTTNDTPTWNDLIGHYIKEMPVCPKGGTYTIGRVGDVPVCSIGGSFDSIQ